MGGNKKVQIRVNQQFLICTQEAVKWCIEYSKIGIEIQQFQAIQTLGKLPANWNPRLIKKSMIALLDALNHKNLVLVAIEAILNSIEHSNVLLDLGGFERLLSSIDLHLNDIVNLDVTLEKLFLMYYIASNSKFRESMNAFRQKILLKCSTLRDAQCAEIERSASKLMTLLNSKHLLAQLVALNTIARIAKTKGKWADEDLVKAVFGAVDANTQKYELRNIALSRASAMALHALLENNTNVEANHPENNTNVVANHLNNHGFRQIYDLIKHRCEHLRRIGASILQRVFALANPWIWTSITFINEMIKKLDENDYRETSLLFLASFTDMEYCMNIKESVQLANKLVNCKRAWQNIIQSAENGSQFEKLCSIYLIGSIVFCDVRQCYDDVIGPIQKALSGNKKSDDPRLLKSTDRAIELIKMQKQAIDVLAKLSDPPPKRRKL